MALQHHEFELWLRDAERLRLYVKAGMAEREMQSSSLKKVELACRRLELEAKESAERAYHAPIPGPTRLADPNQVPRRETEIGLFTYLIRHWYIQVL